MGLLKYKITLFLKEQNEIKMKNSHSLPNLSPAGLKIESSY